MAKHRLTLSSATVLLLLSTLLSIVTTTSASITGQQARPNDTAKFSSEHHIINGHRPTTSILPVKSLNFYHHHPNPDGRNEFSKLNEKAKDRRLTRNGLHDAVVHAKRQSGDIVVMGATSWN